MLTITNAAARKINHLIIQEIGQEKQDTALRLRISVSGGGCSGFQYHFLLDGEKTADDHIFSQDGIEVIIDSTSLDLLDCSEIDYVEDLTASRFVIKNPNAASSCGCGNSFSI